MREKPSDAKDIMDILFGARGEQQDDEKRHLDAFAILSLPEHLRKTAYAIHTRMRASASEISEVTGRELSLEESNLRELVEIGFLGVDIDDPDTFYLHS